MRPHTEDGYPRRPKGPSAPSTSTSPALHARLSCGPAGLAVQWATGREAHSEVLTVSGVLRLGGLRTAVCRGGGWERGCRPGLYGPAQQGGDPDPPLSKAADREDVWSHHSRTRSQGEPFCGQEGSTQPQNSVSEHGGRASGHAESPNDRGHALCGCSESQGKRGNTWLPPSSKLLRLYP